MIPSRFRRQDVDIVERETLFSGFFRLDRIRLQHRTFNGGMSPAIERELFVKAGAAAAIAYDPEHDLIGLVEQFRIGMYDLEEDPWSLEGVAGMVEEDEEPESLIRRELLEEAGLEDATLEYITRFYPTPGSCNEATHLYCALCNLQGKGGIYGLSEEGEDIFFHVFPAESVFDTMLQSRCCNAATLIGLLWLQLNRPRLQTSTGGT